MPLLSRIAEADSGTPELFFGERPLVYFMIVEGVALLPKPWLARLAKRREVNVGLSLV